MKDYWQRRCAPVEFYILQIHKARQKNISTDKKLVLFLSIQDEWKSKS